MHTDTTVTVSAGLSPEELEDDALAKRLVPSFGPKGPVPLDCAKVTAQYPSELIPMAKKAKFPANRAKFLGIAHKSIGECQMEQEHFADAEQSFRDALAQADVWPGKSDSAYPDLLGILATAQAQQDRWDDAVATAKQSVAALQAIIDAKVQAAAGNTGPDAEFLQSDLAKERRSQAAMMAALAMYMARDGQLDDASKTIDTAYDQALANKLKPEYMKQIAKIGMAIATQGGHPLDVAKWTARAVSASASSLGSSASSGDAPKN